MHCPTCHHGFISVTKRFYSAGRISNFRSDFTGQISVQRTILTVKKYKKSYPNSVDAFVEEAVVRRELSDNFCFYNKNYDSINGLSDWARQTLIDHKYGFPVGFFFLINVSCFPKLQKRQTRMDLHTGRTRFIQDAR